MPKLQLESLTYEDLIRRVDDNLYVAKREFVIEWYYINYTL